MKKSEADTYAASYMATQGLGEGCLFLIQGGIFARLSCCSILFAICAFIVVCFSLGSPTTIVAFGILVLILSGLTLMSGVLFMIEKNEDNFLKIRLMSGIMSSFLGLFTVFFITLTYQDFFYLETYSWIASIIIWIIGVCNLSIFIQGMYYLVSYWNNPTGIEHVLQKQINKIERTQQEIEQNHVDVQVVKIQQ